MHPRRVPPFPASTRINISNGKSIQKHKGLSSLRCMPLLSMQAGIPYKHAVHPTKSTAGHPPKPSSTYTAPATKRAHCCAKCTCHTHAGYAFCNPASYFIF
mmetsp:Transcript_11286/g.30782  ORF Transcript_11286/g.30782 Transcript_11286/m.30782 type:complete len:101 (-) Transcript_11286:1429-1731(-)